MNTCPFATPPCPDPRNALEVFKLGGSLLPDPRLRAALHRLAECAQAGRRTVLVCGGGGFADAVRSAQPALGFDDAAAHALALLAMAQTACVLHSWCPALALCRTPEALRAAAERGQAALWMPVDVPPTEVGWHMTSDSFAAWLAAVLGADRLTLVKSCALDPAQPWQVPDLRPVPPPDPAPAHTPDRAGVLRGWIDAGVVDAAFARYGVAYRGAIRVLGLDQLALI